MARACIGRTAELAVIETFTRAIADGPASLMLEGSAGIGKTAIWREGIARAATDGVTVLSCVGTEADAGWAFTGLGDLLDGLPAEVTQGLPEIQQRALAGALLTSDPSDDPLAHHTVAVAVLAVLRALARTAPLLIAIDDVQWLDTDTRTVLSFALRRLRAEPVRLLTSCRTGSVAGSEAGSVTEVETVADLGLAGERLVVGAASVGTLQRLVHLRLGEHFSRPTLTRLHQATGGNPMMFLEMSRALQRRGRDLPVDEPLPVPADLRLLVTERLQGLSAATRELLLVTAALAHPTVDSVAAASADPDTHRAALAEGLAAGVLGLDGERLRFTHPLIGSTAYDELTAAERRELHRRLAASVTDPEQQARHAALGAPATSASVAAALDLAAGQARGRGSLAGAAELAELAVAATPAADAVDRLRRTVTAAELQFMVGDTARARSGVTAGLAAAPPGPGRVGGLLLQAKIASWEQGDATVAQLCQQALAEAGDDPLLQARSHAMFAETSPSGAELDRQHAQRAVELLSGLDAPPPDLYANALTNLALHDCRLGHGLEMAPLERAVALEALGPPPPISDRAGMALGMCLKVVDRFGDSRLWLHAMRMSAIDEGDDSALPNIYGHLAILECWSGSYPLALSYAEEGREHATRIGLRVPMLASAHVLALAHLGRLEEAAELGARDLASDEAIGFDSAVALHRRSLGVTELFAGRADRAGGHFRRALDISRDTIGIGEPAIMRLHADAVEALLTTADDAGADDAGAEGVAAAGDRAEAERLTAELDASSAANHLPWATAMAARCRGLLLAASGDRVGAVGALEWAVVEHARLEMPFETARTRLLLGRALRRAGRHSDARRELTGAETAFAGLGTPVQVAQCRAELAAMGGTAPAGDALTTAEQRIVALVGAGQTSREVAGALFMSVRTVDSHLSHIYRKLGLRSRTELALWVTSHAAEPGVVRQLP